ncbi:MAG: FMN-binding negative transcriptional regulator [Gammaproteobacteria bacterium]
MYTPAAFAESDAARMAEFVAAHPLATLAGVEDGRPVVDHLPFLCVGPLVPGGTLIAHTAKGNATWRLGERGAEVVLAFSGASAYISPSFYPSKRETHQVVPTWNYRTVHVRGTLACTHDRAEKLGIVERLTHHMESGRAEPWAVSDAPADYIDKMLQGIVGLTLTITEVRAKTKASQNRTPADQRGALEGLRVDPASAEAAALIAQRLKD